MRALGHADQHDVHDADAPDQQTHSGDACQQERERLLSFLLGGEKLLAVDDGEVVGLARQNLMFRTEHAFDIHHRPLQRHTVHDAEIDGRNAAVTGYTLLRR